ARLVREATRFSAGPEIRPLALDRGVKSSSNMYDTETACTVTTQPPKGKPQPTVRIRPFRWKPPFRASRAHVMVSRRPALAAAAKELLAACAKSLSEQLAAP